MNQANGKLGENNCSSTLFFRLFLIGETSPKKRNSKFENQVILEFSNRQN
jgi:hypothetical protein